ncbi:uncharacterized protein JCM6883_003478 [Sporobolomyces salmoneus]|uniref:uncharacterized protein n=1 Tax=Sporobolomyces salmoneus TaxID=183962 RepID=UPI00316E0207
MTESTPLLPSTGHRSYTPSLSTSTSRGHQIPPISKGDVNVDNRDELELPDDWVNLKDCNVFHLVHEIYRLFTSEIPIAITEEQMRDPNVVFHLNDVLRSDLETTYNSPCIVYVLLLTRLQFLRERGAALASTTLCETRANYCEYFAIHMLRHQGRSVQGGAKMQQLAMARALVGGLHAFQGASEEVLERIRKNEGGTSRVYAQGAGKTNALELAILGKAKKFIKSDACQRVITAIYDGRITYSSSSFFDLLPDRWKTKDISLYNVRTAPLLDHYRLRVSKYRSMIDVLSFAILFVSFLHVIIDRHSREELIHMSTSELWFFFYALGYSLDRCAGIFEHGWSVFAMGLSAPLDIFSVPIYVSAFVLRVHSVSKMDPAMSDRAYAILSCAACLLFPRIAFTAISKNLFILSLRAMLAEFFYLMSVTVFCFLGFVFALNHLCDGAYSVTRISEWLVFIYFGLDGTGIDKSTKFDPVIGPILFISFAALSNTLLTAVLVAILSTTYSKIAEDADAENMFRKAVMTLEGVKSDSLFDYLPPVNLIAITFLWPLSHVLSERKFHSLNVLCTRILSLPILLLIALYERERVSESGLHNLGDRIKNSLSSRLPVSLSEKMSLLEGAHWETEAVFEYTPSGDEKSDNEDEEDEVTMGADEGIEEWILEGKGPDGQRRVSSRFSSALDPAKVQEAMMEDQRLKPTGGGGGGAGAGGSPMVRRRSSAAPIPISRQASFIQNAAASSSPPSISPPENTSPPVPPPTAEPSILRRTRPRGNSTSAAATTDQSVQFATHARPPRRRTTRDSGATTVERLPPNASTAAGLSSSPQHSQHVEFPQLTATSAPSRESPFIRRYLNGEAVAANSSSNALGRRLSLSQTSRARAWSEAAGAPGAAIGRAAGGGGVDELTMASMMKMIKGLVETVDRLEIKLELQKGKGRERDIDDESAIDDEDDDTDTP